MVREGARADVPPMEGAPTRGVGVPHGLERNLAAVVEDGVAHKNTPA